MITRILLLGIILLQVAGCIATPRFSENKIAISKEPPPKEAPKEPAQDKKTVIEIHIDAAAPAVSTTNTAPVPIIAPNCKIPAKPKAQPRKKKVYKKPAPKKKKEICLPDTPPIPYAAKNS